MQQQPFVVTERTIDHLFARLGVRYGDAWLRKYEGQDARALRLDWQHQLRMVSENALRFGLENLPPVYPPNVSEFRAICLAAPRTMPELAEPAPPRDPARVRAILSRLHAAPPVDPLAWAHRLRHLDEAGEPDPETGRRISVHQRHAYRAALARHDHRIEQTA